MKNFATVCNLSLAAALCLGLGACATSTDDYLATAQNSFVKQNYGVTFNTLVAAAHSDNPRAQYALGYLYYYGMGTQANTLTAIKWISAAANEGLPAAKKALATINAQNPQNIDGDKQTSSNPVIKLGPAVPTISKPSKRALPMPKGYAKNLVYAYSFVRGPKKSNGNTSSSSTATSNNSSSSRTSGNLTLRLAARTTLAGAQNFIKQNSLQGKAQIKTSIIYGKKIYTVTYGLFNSNMQAQRAIKKLPANLQKNKPWVQKIN